MAFDDFCYNAALELLDQRPDIAATATILRTPGRGAMIEFECAGWDLSFDFLPSGKIEFFGVEFDTDNITSSKTLDTVEDALSAFDNHNLQIKVRESSNLNENSITVECVLEHWKPEDGKPFDWLPDLDPNGTFVWFESLPQEIQENSNCRMWLNAEIEYSIYLLENPKC